MPSYKIFELIHAKTACCIESLLNFIRHECNFHATNVRQISLLKFLLEAESQTGFC